MQDANVPDIAIEPDKTVKKVQVHHVMNTHIDHVVLKAIVL